MMFNFWEKPEPQLPLNHVAENNNSGFSYHARQFTKGALLFLAGATTYLGFKTFFSGEQTELQSDDLGVKLMLQAGYEPDAMIEVMKILRAAAGPNHTPELMSTHPDPENRI